MLLWTIIVACSTAFFTLVLAIATFSLARKTSQTVAEMKASRLAQERPLVKVSIDRSRQYYLFMVVENVGRTPALNLKFGFSSPLIHPGVIRPERYNPDRDRREVVLSEEVSFLAKGLNFLAPGDNVSVFWGGTNEIMEGLRKRGLAEKGLTVTVSYEAVSGERFENEEWTLNPTMYDEPIWFVFTTPEMLIDKAAGLADKLGSAIDSGRLKVRTTKERKGRWWHRPLGWSRRRWARELLLIKLRSWRQRFLRS